MPIIFHVGLATGNILPRQTTLPIPGKIQIIHKKNTTQYSHTVYMCTFFRLVGIAMHFTLKLYNLELKSRRDAKQFLRAGSTYMIYLYRYMYLQCTFLHRLRYIYRNKNLFCHVKTKALFIFEKKVNK